MNFKKSRNRNFSKGLVHGFCCEIEFFFYCGFGKKNKPKATVC